MTSSPPKIAHIALPDQSVYGTPGSTTPLQLQGKRWHLRNPFQANSVTDLNIPSARNYKASPSIQAELVLAASNAQLVVNPSVLTNDVVRLTAVDAGVTDISITYVDPAANSQVLAVTVAGHDITVSLATDSSGVITTTGADITTAINADVDASAIVTAANVGTGAGLVTAYPQTLLTSLSTIRYKAITAGTDGNLITVAYIDPEDNSQSLSVSRAGNVVRVSLATNGSGVITTIASEIVTIINADAFASTLITAVSLDAGTSVVQAVSATALTGGN